MNSLKLHNFHVEQFTWTLAIGNKEKINCWTFEWIPFQPKAFVLYFVHVSVVSLERTNGWLPMCNMNFWCVGGTT